MEQTYRFQIRPLDPAALRPQVSRALEKRLELASRARLPRLWAITDKRNSVDKGPEHVRARRRRMRTVLGLINWLLGTFLLIPSVLSPQELFVPLLAGLVGYCTGVVFLLAIRPRRLGGLSLIEGAVFLFGALGAPEELGGLLPLAIAALAVGLVGLLTGRRPKRRQSDRDAEALLRGRDTIPTQPPLTITFGPESMVISAQSEPPVVREFPYAKLTMAIETADLLLPIFEDEATVLQKSDLIEGDMEGLRALLSAHAVYAFADP